MPQDDDRWGAFTVKMRKDQIEEFDEKFKSKSGSARRILDTWMQVVEDNDIDDDLKKAELVILKTYLNAVEKNIETMKAQRDKLESRIEEMEEEDNGEVVLEVDLRMKQWDL